MFFGKLMVRKIAVLRHIAALIQTLEILLDLENYIRILENGMVIKF
jgi:hypothetical protein